MTGREYVKDLYKVLSYQEAIQSSMQELEEMGINGTYDIYDNDEIYDNPIYPANEELYDEFNSEEYGFDITEYFMFIARKIEAKNMESVYNDRYED